MIVKKGVAVAGFAGLAALGAWASPYMAAIAQASGVTIEADLMVQLVMTAVIVGIAFGVVRSKVEGMSKRFDQFEATLADDAKQVERYAERLDHHADEIKRLRDGHTRRAGRQPTSESEDV